MTQRREDQRGFWERFWNEFFFAREFDYETPLTPDEVADVLREQVDGSERKASWWDTGMKNEVEITRQGDKQQEFVINAMGKGWGSRVITSRTIGMIQANPENGLTTVSGKTTFGRSHYIGIFLIGLIWAILLAMSLSAGERVGETILWLVMYAAFFWYTYRDRNEQFKFLDEAIMTAKPKMVGERLALPEDELQSGADEVNKQEPQTRQAKLQGE